MGKYIIKLSKKAIKDLEAIKKSGNKRNMKKFEILISELELHPKFGSGSPELLRYYCGEVWSREVNKKDRLIYEIFENEMLILVVLALGHYNDK